MTVVRVSTQDTDDVLGRVTLDPARLPVVLAAWSEHVQATGGRLVPDTSGGYAIIRDGVVTVRIRVT